MNKNEQLEQQLHSKEEVQKDLQRQIEVLEKEIAKPCQQCSNYESQVVKLQGQLKVREKEEKGCELPTISTLRARADDDSEFQKQTMV